MSTPLKWRVDRRVVVDPRAEWTSRVIGLVIASAVAAVALQVSGNSAWTLFTDGVDTSLVGLDSIDATLTQATPIVLAALAVALAFRVKAWNIGVDGQFFAGAIGATYVGIHLDAPEPIALMAMVTAGAIGGALWILIPALARVYAGVNEIITTLLLNFVAIELTNYLALGPWRDKEAGVLSASRRIAFEFPSLLGRRASLGALLILLLGLLLWFVFRYTKWGYEVDMVGGNARAAATAGIPVERRVLAVMLWSGAIAGMAGAIQLSGVAHRLSGTLSNQYGLSGFVAAALAGTSILAVVIVGFMVSALLSAGLGLAARGFTVSAVVAVFGLILYLNALSQGASQFRIKRNADPPGTDGALAVQDNPIPGGSAAAAPADSREGGEGQ